ncbi:VWA domain-containing protein [Polaromonas sp. JS666]|uniref:VWA domain-containing protein n=1 Tax=Polaromonas sp. (strain JS666 / ATCC BAA-500) TaxID=296591 RepID=UPI000053254A|nr:VWA domain-containing protein [Polaromonas sp. JS666]ABE47349.1 von Willebrand factor, type A [Polaromonas sp. JS666]
MSDSVLLKSLPYMLSIVAAGAGVDLRTDPRATTAATNGRVVILPPLPYTGDELAIYSLGYIVHESGHIRQTDFTAVGTRPTDELHRMLVNVLEDIRIERLINGVFPGARHWLDALTLKFVETRRQGVNDPDAELPRKLIRYLQDWLYESVLHYKAVAGIGVQQREVWRNSVSQSLADQIEKIALQAAWASSTHAVVVGADRIVDLLRQEVAEVQSEADSEDSGDAPQSAGSESSSTSPPPGDGDGDEKEATSPAEADENVAAGPGGEADPEEQSEDEAGQPGQSAGSIADGDSNAAASAAAASGLPGDGKSSVPAGSPSNQDQSPGFPGTRESYVASLQEALDTPALDEGVDRGDVIREEIRQNLVESRANRDATFKIPEVFGVQGSKSDAVAIQRVRAASTALQYGIEELLQAQTRKRFTSAEYGKRLTRDAGLKMALGNPRIYQRRTETQKVDTAVHLLLDISDSMSVKGRCAVALDAALALGLALDGVQGVTYSVSAFPFQRYDVADLVRPGESIRDVAHRFRAMAPNGTTPMDVALIHAHTVLLSSPAQRRVCLLVTDGAPDDVAAAKLMIEMGEGDGIEHMAVGIETQVSHLSRSSCVVDSIADLPKQVMAMIQSVILLPMAA